MKDAALFGWNHLIIDGLNEDKRKPKLTRFIQFEEKNYEQGKTASMIILGSSSASSIEYAEGTPYVLAGYSI